MNDYPLFLDLTDRPVLVVGAGTVATKRVERLLTAGAQVRVIAPQASEQIAALALAGRLQWLPRSFRPEDVVGNWLVHIATGVAQVDDAAVAAADEQRIWSVRAADRQRSRAWSAATASVDGVTVAVSAGGDPRRAVAVRDAVAAGLRAGDIPARRRRKPSPDGGRVALVGAGPGDPELVTLRARRLLKSADVVVADHLAPAALLDGLDVDVEIKYAGKRPGHHSLTQEQINAFIVQRAREGHRVVRLKGGDPFLLGRGGEEALACKVAGVPVEVVPGISSAVSVPAAAGIPVTHRGITSSFVLLSGHAGARGIAEQVGAAPTDATLVLLMGTRHLAAIAETIIATGRPATTPAAVIADGWTPQQRTVTGTLADIADTAARARIGSPAVVVFGEVAALRNQLGDLAEPSALAGHTLPEHTAGTAGVDGGVGEHPLAGLVPA